MPTPRFACSVFLFVAIGCSGPQSAGPGEAGAALAAERSRLDAIIRKVLARDLCADPLDAASRRANYQAANERHKRTLDTISRLDWRTATITEAQIEALNTAKLQINRAEVIDLALALQQDFKPPSGKRVEAAYREHGPVVERLASERWETSTIGERDSKALAMAGRAFLAARQIDLAEILTSSPAEYAAAALAIHGDDVRRLAKKDWTKDSPTRDETEALGGVVASHLRDVGSALARMVDRGRTEAVRKAYDERRALFQGLIAKPAADKATTDEEKAVCDVLEVYQQADRGGS